MNNEKYTNLRYIWNDVKTEINQHLVLIDSDKND